MKLYTSTWDVSKLNEDELETELERLEVLLKNKKATTNDAIRTDRVREALGTIRRVKSGR